MHATTLAQTIMVSIQGFINYRTHANNGRSRLMEASVGKIPKNLSPAPTPKFGDFRGFPLKKSPKFEFPCPQSIPKPFKG